MWSRAGRGARRRTARCVSWWAAVGVPNRKLCVSERPRVCRTATCVSSRGASRRLRADSGAVARVACGSAPSVTRNVRFGSHGVDLDFCPRYSTPNAPWCTSPGSSRAVYRESIRRRRSRSAPSLPAGTGRGGVLLLPQSSLDGDGNQEHGDRNNSGDHGQAKQDAAENHCSC